MSKKHPVREILENGGMVDGEAFDLMLKEESMIKSDEIIRGLKKIRDDLQDIKSVIGYVDTFLDDTGNRYITIKVPDNQEEDKIYTKLFESIKRNSKMYEVYMSFKYPVELVDTDFASCLWFDSETKEIVVDEQSLMRVIMMVNSYQEPRKIRMVTREEMRELMRKRG